MQSETQRSGKMEEAIDVQIRGKYTCQLHQTRKKNAARLILTEDKSADSFLVCMYALCIIIWGRKERKELLLKYY